MKGILTVDRLRNCLEGVIPAGVATCGRDGMPNVTYVSQVMYVDQDHVALSFQFFNKTRENILVNPLATVLVVDPETSARYRLTIRYLRTETAGPLFERMKAKLAGIASHEGLVGVFKLRGTDLYRVLDIESVPGPELPHGIPGPAILPALRRSSDSLACCENLECLLDNLLDSLEHHFQLHHAMILIAETAAERLYVVASRGYPASGIGAEIPYGIGVIGVAARERVPIRIMFAAAEYAYGRALRQQALADGLIEQPGRLIPMPGLADPASQLAVPLLSGTELFGVLYTESREECRFDYDLEDALVSLCAQAGFAIRLQQQMEESTAGVAPQPQPAQAVGPAMLIEYYVRDSSVFLDGDYLIKGVAGAILWRLLTDYEEQGRTEFTNRELRLDARLKLPEICDNLESRLILLTRRLEERNEAVRLVKTGRGRFRLEVYRSLRYIERPDLPA